MSTEIKIINLNWADSADKSWAQLKADFAGSVVDSDEALGGYQTDRARRLAAALGIDIAAWDNAGSILWLHQSEGPAQPELHVLVDGRWAVVQGGRVAIEAVR